MITYILVAVTIAIIAFLIYVKKVRKELPTDEKLQQIKDKIILIEPKASNLNFYTDAAEAYILDKKDIHMCLRNKDNHYYDDNFLMYIALHEVAHALMPGNTDNHPPQFDQKLNELLDKAKKARIYDATIPFPTEYCQRELKYY